MREEGLQGSKKVLQKKGEGAITVPSKGCAKAAENSKRKRGERSGGRKKRGTNTCHDRTFKEGKLKENHIKHPQTQNKMFKQEKG